MPFQLIQDEKRKASLGLNTGSDESQTKINQKK